MASRLKTIVAGSDERATWPWRLDFLAAAISYTTPLSVIMRFPYLVYKSGGEVFFIPFMFFMVVLGLPMIFLEISLGQFTSSGALTCWRMAPIFQGVGAAMVFLSAISAILHSQIVAWAFYYLFASFTSQLPWANCDPEWKSDDCLGTLSDGTACSDFGWTSSSDGGCYDNSTNLKAIWNTNGTASRYNRRQMLYSSSDFFTRQVLQSHKSEGLNDIGDPVWHNVLCSLLVWVIIVVVLGKSVRMYGKVAYVTTIFPLLALIILLIYGRTLDGHDIGKKFFTYPNKDKLKDLRTWKDAGVTVMFQLSLSFGGLITLGSYNRFNNDTYRDSAIILTMNIVFSVISGFAIFYFFGAFAMSVDTSIQDIVDSGISLIFIGMPLIWTTITSAPTFWSILWFLMIICLGIGPLLGYVETVITAVTDVFPKLRRFRLPLVICTCTLFFLLALPYTTEGGSAMLTWIDVSGFRWSFWNIGILEIVAVILYGVPRFLRDVEVMTGSRIFGILPAILGKLWMGFFLFLPALAAVTFIAVALRLDDDYDWGWPDWADKLGQVVTWTPQVLIILGAMVAIIVSLVKNCRTNPKDWCSFMTPTREWGPARVEHRALVKTHIPWFEVNPWGNDPVAEENIMTQL